MTTKHRQDVTRRDFICTAGAMAGAAVLGTSVGPLPAAAAVTGGELARRTLGRTKLDVTVMTLGSAPAGIARDVSLDELGRIVNLAIDLGINFIDTAPKYGKAEEGIGRVLGSRRQNVYLATKVWADTIADAEQSLTNSLKALETDYVDVLYFHHLGGRLVERARDADGVFTWLLKQKQAGKCRFVGISGHNIPDRFAPFLESGDVDVILVPVNFADRYTYQFEEKVLPVARKHNVGIVAMKVFGGPDPKSGSWGTRDAKPLIGEENVELAIRYALSVPGVATANLGVHTAEQLRENVEFVKRFQPLSEEERQLAARLGRPMAEQWGPHFGPVDEPPEDLPDTSD
jgi:predicted aldo/keto reductase-like oxidoreductase